MDLSPETVEEIKTLVRHLQHKLDEMLERMDKQLES